MSIIYIYKHCPFHIFNWTNVLLQQKETERNLEQRFENLRGDMAQQVGQAVLIVENRLVSV